MQYIKSHLLCGDPPSFGQSLLTVDVDWIDADEPEKPKVYSVYNQT